MRCTRLILLGALLALCAPRGVFAQTATVPSSTPTRTATATKTPTNSPTPSNTPTATPTAYGSPLPRGKHSLPISAYYYETGALTAGINKFVLKGVAPGFTPLASNFLVFAHTTTSATPAATPVAAYVTFDEASLIVDPFDPTQVRVNLWASAGVTNAIIYMGGI